MNDKLNLSLLEKPSRYIDHEINAVHKDFASAEVKVCFAFPDVYEIGISHLGLKILYSIVNRLSYAMADRTYLPWLDGLKQFREKQIPLFALESKQAVKDFDLLGITLQSELTFTNVLELLDISGIPVMSADRNDSHPILIAGGPCASNPLPLSPFIDAFLIGEGEEAITEIVNIIRLNKAMFGKSRIATPGFLDEDNSFTAGMRDAGCASHFPLPASRAFILQALSQVAGVYVPSIHDDIVTRNPAFRIRIRKYNEFHTHENIHEPQLMPWQLATHNRYVAEIMRGCTRGCRFCHAGYFYRPVRERSPHDILDAMLHEIEKYGWEEAGLISLSSSDYTCIKPLLEALIRKVDKDKTHISLPSLRVDAIDNSLVTLLKEVGREGLTIAPEAGSQRLRNIINKNITEEDILTGIRIAKELGWQGIKLYFMIGLPNETEEDITAIIDLINLILNETGKHFQINITISPFVPKPHTPFQWSPMPDGTELLRRALSIKHAFMRFRFIKIRYHTIENSLLEAVISRGDKQSADWIKAAWSNGAVYDGWNESFNWEYWIKAAADVDYDIQQIYQPIPVGQSLPWDFISLGISKEWFVQEWCDACAEKTSVDCRNGCIGCGICRGETRMNLLQDTSIIADEGLNEGNVCSAAFRQFSTDEINSSHINDEFKRDSYISQQTKLHEGSTTNQAKLPEASTTNRAKLPEGSTTSQTKLPEGSTTNQTKLPEGITTNQAKLPEGSTTNQTKLPEGITTNVMDKQPGYGANYIKSWIYRLSYQKGGDFRYIGHLDWMRMIYRILGRCKLAIVYTQGFNPHPKVSFSPSLAIGVCGTAEFFDFFTSQEYTIPGLLSAFQPMFEHGLALNAITAITSAEHNLQPGWDVLNIILPDEDSLATAGFTPTLSDVTARVNEFKRTPEFLHTIIRKEKLRTYDLKAIVNSIYISENKLYIEKKLESPNIYELLSVIINIPRDELQEWYITRTGFLYAETH